MDIQGLYPSHGNITSPHASAPQRRFTWVIRFSTETFLFIAFEMQRSSAITDVGSPKCCSDAFQRRLSIRMNRLLLRPSLPRGSEPLCHLGSLSSWLPGHRQHRPLSVTRLAASQAQAIQALINTPIGQLSAASLSHLLQSTGIFVLCICLGVFLLGAIPCLWSLARAAYRAEAVLKVVQEDLPQMSALIRLSGLEVVEAVSEMSRLGSDLSSGVRSIATLATDTEQGIRQGISGTEAVITKGLAPAMAKAEGSLRQAMEAELLQRAQLGHTRAAIEGLGKAAEAAAGAARNAMVGMQAARLAVGAGSVVRRVMERAAETNLTKLRRGSRRMDATQSLEE